MFALPADVRRRIWKAARRRHLEALLARKAAAQFTTPEGFAVARLVVSPTKLMHLGVSLHERGPQVLEIVDGDRVTERWWMEAGIWTCRIRKGCFTDQGQDCRGAAVGCRCESPFKSVFPRPPEC